MPAEGEINEKRRGLPYEPLERLSTVLEVSGIGAHWEQGVEGGKLS